MGVDLTLLPILSSEQRYSRKVIRVERRRDLWSEIWKLPTVQMTSPLRCHLAHDEQGEAHYGELSEDAYGTPIETISADDLVSLKDSKCVQDNWKNRGVWALLSELPGDTRFALYWH